MESSRQEYWSGGHLFLQGIFLSQGWSPHLLCLWQQADSLPLCNQVGPYIFIVNTNHVYALVWDFCPGLKYFVGSGCGWWCVWVVGVDSGVCRWWCVWVVGCGQWGLDRFCCGLGAGSLVVLQKSLDWEQDSLGLSRIHPISCLCFDGATWDFSSLTRD